MSVVVLAALLLLAAPGSAQDSPLVSSWSGSGLGDLLARPLPGTPERTDDDLARALESTLIGFMGIDRARVIVTSHEVEAASSPSRRVAVQLTLAENYIVDPRWMQGIVDFITSAVPELDARNLTIVDTTGNTLYARSAVAIPPPSATTTSTGTVRADVGWQGWALMIAAVVGAVIVAALLVLSGRRSTKHQPPEPEPELGPFAFLEALRDDELHRVLQDERPEVIALVAYHLDEAQRDRVRAVIAQELPVVMAGAEPDPEVVAVVAAALRRKLVKP